MTGKLLFHQFMYNFLFPLSHCSGSQGYALRVYSLPRCKETQLKQSDLVVLVRSRELLISIAVPIINDIHLYLTWTFLRQEECHVSRSQ